MMFGYPVDELMGRSITVLIPAGRREGFLGSFSGMVSGSANSSLENPIEMPGLRKDGTEFPTEYTVASWVTGGERFYAAIIRDVTDRRKAGEERERLLKRLNERLKELGALYWLSKLVETPGMTIDKILEGLVEILRAAWQYPEITYSRVALGRIEFRSDNYSDTAWKQSERIVVHGEAEGILEVGYLEYMPGEYEGPFLKEERRLIGAIAERLGRIVERTRAEEELQRSNIELQGFARTVSHDLKGPLTGIKLSVETLEGMLGDVLDEDSKGEIKELLEIASSGVDRSSRLIDDLLALAEAGQAKEDIEDVDVSGTVADILDDRAATIKERNVNVIVDDDLGHVEASPVHMYQVFANLIGNAIKHNKSDKPEITVKSLGADGESRRRYLIRDNGTGIPPENLDNIFIPFFKGAETGETGIGLSTVKKVVELYGGEIRAYNDEGACFEFTLPGSGESSIPGSDMTDKDTLFVPDD
jgi:PAS domain S-box-containing protein